MTAPRHATLSALATATALLLAGAASQAGATPLSTSFGGNPFVDTPLSGTTSAARPELAGTILNDVDTPFTLGAISGVVQNRVVRETTSGTLDFYWRVILDPASTAGGVTAFRVGDFGYASLTDADYRIDGLGSDVVAKARLFNPAGHPSGDINFLFDSPLPADTSSNFFFLHTDATNYALSAVYDMTDLSGNISNLFSTFAPAAAVPEPTPASVLALGLLTLGWLRSRRSRARD